MANGDHQYGKSMERTLHTMDGDHRYGKSAKVALTQMFGYCIRVNMS